MYAFTTLLPLLATLATSSPLNLARGPGPVAGEYAGYSLRNCVDFSSNVFPIVNTCHALPYDSIKTLDQACGTGWSADMGIWEIVKVYTNDDCTGDVKTAPVGACTNTLEYFSVKVVCG
ncbi:hypothetical protein MMC11_008149 [Xylographa trunciseda]|nr:hypothetical protein [Xylographa trunciseda]